MKCLVFTYQEHARKKSIAQHISESREPKSKSHIARNGNTKPNWCRRAH